MATVSPTPMATGPARRISQRQAALRRPPSRSAIDRSESQQAAWKQSAPARSQSKKYHDDSSEDEFPVPMKLSALTKALLSDGGPDPAAAAAAGRPERLPERLPERPPSPPRTRRRTSALNASISTETEQRRHMRSGSAQAPDGKSSGPASPIRSREVSPVRKRVVRLSNTPQSVNQMQLTKRRSTSMSRSTQRPQAPQNNRPPSRDKSSEERPDSQQDVNTPAQPNRVVRIAAGSSGNRNRVDSAGPSSGKSSFDRSVVDKSSLEADYDQSEVPETVARNSGHISHGSVSRYQSTRSKPDDIANLQSSMRIKRVGKIPGTFLSGPARRGRRRQSEEDGEGNEGEHFISSQEPDSHPADDGLDPYYPGSNREFNSGSPVSGNAAARAIHRRHLSNMDIQAGSRSGSEGPSPRGIEIQPKKQDEIPYRNHVPQPHIPPTYEQENDIPSAYKRPKSSVDDLLDKVPRRPLSADLGVAKASTSPDRKPLASLASNTPRRAAPPPPPKMSVLEAATTTTGPATTQTKQRRNILRVNGKSYTRLDCLGRGGSAKVYRVTAENGHMFALKRVSLENADESTIKGFKGEIDLLGTLAGVDRVVNLYAYEMNQEKQVLSLVMEMGERDLNHILTDRQKAEFPKFDPVFVRFYWKEMLECLHSVHQHDIVHSDLKPANFVLVKGQLKLIDFGIANAIQTDETVNVHRETQIGTPNYMSPESLVDANNPRGQRMPGRPKLMKLGKPSDIWSLGCILYQLVYGVQPFGHIVNPLSRCQAIINWDHNIDFPSRGMGGMSVPPSLLRTMKRCLNRDQHMRPTCEELLHETDPFLYPMEVGDRALPIDEELLGRIIQSVVTRCRERMPTEAESTSVWPQAYWTSIRKAMAANRS